MGNLEKSLKILKDKRYSLIEAEIYAINNLSEKEEIEEFYKKYLIRIKEEIEKNINNIKLIKEGNSVDWTAEYLAKDHLSYTLGHITDAEKFVRWYTYLPILRKNFRKK